MINKVFKADVKELALVNEFIEGELEKFETPFKVVTQINLAVEELFVNIAHYAYENESEENTAEISIDFDETEKQISISFVDSGVKFDPLAKEDPDITLSAEERKIGGLGIHLVKQLMDNVTYEYKNNKNILTIYKKI